MSVTKLNSKTYFEEAKKSLVGDLKGANSFEIPAIEKVSINVGTGKFEKSETQEIANLLEKLTGQKPSQKASNVAINGFSLKKGQINGVSVNLRGEKAQDFIFNLINISLPRTKDFRGIKETAFDSNYTSFSIGMPYAGIFPQIGFSAKVNFGLQVNITFKNPDEKNLLLLKKLGFPFKK